MNSSRLIGLILSVASGAAALAHQTIWTRRLVDVLGASAETFSKVVGAFFLGLALGAWIASRRKSTDCDSWRRVAIAEFAVALLALPILFSPAWSEPLLQLASLTPWIKLLLPLLLVGLPAVAMGLVLPWMLQALLVRDPLPSSLPVWLYAANTLGGLLGIGAVLLAPIPSLGLTNTGLCACGLNLLVAFAALTLHFMRSAAVPAAVSGGVSPPGTTRGVTSREPAGEDARATKLLPWLAFASGFLVLSLEVVLQHQLAQVTINSMFSGGAVLGLMLFALTAAAALVTWLARRLGERTSLRIALGASAVLCAVQPFLLTGMRDGVSILPYELTALPYAWEVLKLGAIAIWPTVIAAGLVFPLLLRSGAQTEPIEAARRIGVLLAWNGVGGWLGTEFAQGWLAPTFGLWVSMAVLGAGYAVIGIIYDLRFAIHALERERLTNRKSKIVKGVALAAGIELCAWFARTLPQATILPGERLAAVRAGREGVVATVECGPGDWRMLFNNSYTLGGSKAQFNQERQGLLPLLLHGNPKSVATLGVATGSTVAGVALHPQVERIHAIELSPLVLRYADEFFSPFNRDVFRDARAKFLPDDARWVIARDRETYDVVVGDLFLPWRTGEGRLFAREHFENVRRALTPDGLFCQWLPLFQLTRPQFETIARTFRSVFPDAFLVRGDFYCELPIIGLLGGRKFDQLDWAKIELQCGQLRTAANVTDPLVRHAEGVAMLTLGPLPDPGAGPINTLANAWLEWDAGRNILGLRSPWFLGVPYAEYVRDIQRASQQLLPAERRAAHEAGQFLLTLDVAAHLNLPARADMEAQIPQRLPAALLRDAHADWRQWPSRVKPVKPFEPNSSPNTN